MFYTKNNWSYRLCCNFVWFWINVLLKLSNIFGSLFLLALEPKWKTSFSRSMVLSMIMPAIPSPAISFHIYWKKSIWAVIQKSLYISPTESYLYWSNVLAWHRVAISKEWTFTLDSKIDVVIKVSVTLKKFLIWILIHFCIKLGIDVIFLQKFSKFHLS